MDSGVAIRASAIKSPGLLAGNTGSRCRVQPVALVALEAQKRLPGVEELAVDRTMRAVAVEAIFGHIRMFVKERASFVGMALDTGFLDAVLEQTVVGESSMGIVAVNTEYPALLEGMMARHGKLSLDGLMAGKTKTAGVTRGYF